MKSTKTVVSDIHLSVCKKNKTKTLKLMARHLALIDREEDMHHKKNYIRSVHLVVVTPA